MSRIDDLIAKHCPDGVEFKEMGEVGEFIRGRRFTKNDIVPNGIGSIHYGEIYTHYGTSATSVLSRVRADLAPQLRFARNGDLVIAAVGETVEDVCKAVAWLGEDEIAVHDDCLIYRHTMSPVFVSYFFQTAVFHAQKNRHVARAKIKRVSGESLGKLIIPVPPLEIQREIAKVLDTFSELEAELEAVLKAEVEARRLQYKFYRDALLSFDERTLSASKQASKQASIRWMTLGEIGTFVRGRRFTKADFVEDGVGCIHYGEIYTHFGTSAKEVMSRVRPEMRSGLRFAKPGDVVITDVGETVEDVGKAVAWVGDEEVAIHDHCYAFRHSMNPKFVSYCMQTSAFIAQKAKYVARTKVNTLLMGGFSKIRIPVPPLEEQERIVAILDMFDALVNDISSGLPAEIKARRQQYTHYRDRLLTFRDAA